MAGANRRNAASRSASANVVRLSVGGMGKRNWLFASTEVGARRVGIIQSLMVTCRLHGVDPYTYLVDVLQRISEHPAKRVRELTPRMWKSLFAHDPLPSALGHHLHEPPPH